MMVFAHKHKRTLLIFSGLLLVLLILGSSYYYRTGLSDKRPPDSSSGTAEESGDSSAEGGGTGEMVREVSKTEPGSVLVCRRFYIRCRHTVTEETAMAARYVGKTGEDLRLAYPAWDLVAFTPERAVFTVNIDGYCPNHYIIREEGGYLIIYRPEKESGELYPVEETDIRYEWLTPEMQEQIDEGLAVDTIEEVENLMENWAS